MDITPQLHENAPLITRYGGGGFVIGGIEHRESVLITPNEITKTNIHSIDGISLDILNKAISSMDGIEVILFGCGMQAELLPNEIRKHLDEKQIGYDVMDTGAACRTFNVLLAEDRKVAAILIAV